VRHTPDNPNNFACVGAGFLGVNFEDRRVARDGAAQRFWVPQVSCFETWVLRFPFFPPRLRSKALNPEAKKLNQEKPETQVQKN